MIGYAEYVSLPDWSIEGLRAKVDTGARSSALHVDGIQRLPGKRVRFEVVVNRKSGRRVAVETDIVREGRVRSSSGKSVKRMFVKTVMKLGPCAKEIEVSLASRDPMRFRMLLGRTALAHDFLVDAGRHSVAGSKPKRAKAVQKKPRHGNRKKAEIRTKTPETEEAR